MIKLAPLLALVMVLSGCMSKSEVIQDRIDQAHFAGMIEGLRMCEDSKRAIYNPVKVEDLLK